MSYLKTRRDANHNEIVSYLRHHGCEVEDTSAVGKIPDTLVWRNGTVAWVEIKVPGSRACFYRKQLEYISQTRHNVVIATSPEMALIDIREKRWLTPRMKDCLAAMLIFSDKNKFTPAEVAKAIGKTV